MLIAEIGVNYYDIVAQRKISLMEAAKLMIFEAYKSGVHAVKFQTYKAGTLAAKKITIVLGYHGRTYNIAI